MDIDKIHEKLHDDYIKISNMKDKTNDEYRYEFLHGQMIYIEMLTDWLSFEEEMEL